jgi:hypothetical protein
MRKQRYEKFIHYFVKLRIRGIGKMNINEIELFKETLNIIHILYELKILLCIFINSGFGHENFF